LTAKVTDEAITSVSVTGHGFVVVASIPIVLPITEVVRRSRIEVIVVALEITLANHCELAGRVGTAAPLATACGVLMIPV